MTVGSLFAGIGGFDLAAEWMGWRTVWFSEIDRYASAVLAARFPLVPNLGNVVEIDFTKVERPNIVCGGFPCQPHSIAGNREASDDDRDLWSECVRAVRDLRPDYAVFENVPGLLTSEYGGFFNRVLSDLAAIGYDAEWDVLRAEDFGIPQSRPRLFLVAYPTRSSTQAVFPLNAVDAQRDYSRLHESSARPSDAYHEDRRPRTVPLLGDAAWPQVPHGERSGDDDRIPRGLDLARYKAVGNSVSPHCVVGGPFARIVTLEAERVSICP